MKLFAPTRIKDSYSLNGYIDPNPGTILEDPDAGPDAKDILDGSIEGLRKKLKLEWVYGELHLM